MRILIINFEYPPLGGGGGVATKLLAEKMAAEHQVVVLTTKFPGLASKEISGGLVIRRVAVLGRKSRPTASLLSMGTFVPTALWAGWQLCRRHKFDVINAQFVLPSGLVAAVLSRIYRVPLVVSFIGGDLYDPSKGTSPHRHATLRLMVRLVAGLAEARTAISEDTRRHARELHGVRQPITVVHLGIEPCFVQKRSRHELGLSERAAIFVAVGRLIPRKGYETLIRAWRDVPDAQLIILGSGPQRQSLKELIVRLGLDKRVQLRGYVSDQVKQDLLQAADGYVSASRHEGFGLVFLEAMAAGLPIVATDRGGQTDFLVPGENAWLVSPGDAEALAAAVRELLDNGAQAAEMGSQNKSKVKHFYLDATVRHFEEIFSRAVSAYENRR